MTRLGIETWSREPLLNTLLIRPMARLTMYLYIYVIFVQNILIYMFVCRVVLFGLFDEYILRAFFQAFNIADDTLMKSLNTSGKIKA